MPPTPDIPLTPWGDEKIVWRHEIDAASDRGYVCFTALRNVISDPRRSHIVREVTVNAPFLPQKSLLTIAEADDTIALAENEFDRLYTICGVEVARPEWHVINSADSPEGIVQVLARTPIVDGEHADEEGDGESHIPENRLQILKVAITNYINDHEPLEPFLNDIGHAQQYVYGQYRFPAIVGREVAVQPIMIDPDLIFSNRTIQL